LLEARIKPHKSTNIFVQFTTLAYRQLLVVSRNPLATWLRLIQTIMVALILGLIYLRLGDSQQSIQDREGALFFIVVNIGFSPLMLAAAVFPPERTIFIREHSMGCYSTMAYYWSKILAETPFQLVFPFVFSAIIYWMLGLQAHADKFFIFVSCLVAVSYTGYGLGMTLCAGAPTVAVAMALTPMVGIPLMLLAGLFVNSGSIPDYIIWAKYLSPFKYGFSIVAQNEFNGLTFTCTASEAKNGTCPYTTGGQVLSALDMDNTESQIWFAFMMLGALYIFYVFIGWLLLYFTAGRKKG